MDGGLLNLFAVIVLLGLCLWAVNAFIPMLGAIKSILNALAVIVIILFILQYFGVIHTVIPMIQLIH